MPSFHSMTLLAPFTKDIPFGKGVNFSSQALLFATPIISSIKMYLFETIESFLSLIVYLMNPNGASPVQVV